MGIEPLMPWGEFFIFVLAWLIVAAWQDVRKGEVSNWLTIPPLFLSAFSWLARGEWSVPALLVAMLVTGEALERLHRPAMLGIGSMVCIASCLGFGVPREVLSILVVWVCAWAAWTLHFVGGADAKVFMTLVAFFPDTALISWLIGMQVVWSVYHLIRRYKGKALAVVLVEMASRPTAEDLEARGVPLLPAWAAAGGFFFSFNVVLPAFVTAFVTYVVNMQARMFAVF